jgi:hypothetical protein
MAKRVVAGSNSFLRLIESMIQCHDADYGMAIMITMLMIKMTLGDVNGGDFGENIPLLWSLDASSRGDRSQPSILKRT